MGDYTCTTSIALSALVHKTSKATKRKAKGLKRLLRTQASASARQGADSHLPTFDLSAIRPREERSTKELPPLPPQTPLPPLPLSARSPQSVALRDVEHHEPRYYQVHNDRDSFWCDDLDKHPLTGPQQQPNEMERDGKPLVMMMRLSTEPLSPQFPVDLIKRLSDGPEFSSRTLAQKGKEKADSTLLPEPTITVSSVTEKGKEEADLTLLPETTITVSRATLNKRAKGQQALQNPGSYRPPPTKVPLSTRKARPRSRARARSAKRRPVSQRHNPPDSPISPAATDTLSVCSGTDCAQTAISNSFTFASDCLSPMSQPSCFAKHDSATLPMGDSPCGGRANSVPSAPNSSPRYGMSASKPTSALASGSAGGNRPTIILPSSLAAPGNLRLSCSAEIEQVEVPQLGSELPERVTISSCSPDAKEQASPRTLTSGQRSTYVLSVDFSPGPRSGYSERDIDNVLNSYQSALAELLHSRSTPPFSRSRRQRTGTHLHVSASPSPSPGSESHKTPSPNLGSPLWVSGSSSPGWSVPVVRRKNSYNSTRTSSVSLLPIGETSTASLPSAPSRIATPSASASRGLSSCPSPALASSIAESSSCSKANLVDPPVAQVAQVRIGHRRLGSIPNPIRVVRDPKDQRAYKLSSSPNVLSATTWTLPLDNSAQQTFPETPSALSPSLSSGPLATPEECASNVRTAENSPMLTTPPSSPLNVRDIEITALSSASAYLMLSRAATSATRARPGAMRRHRSLGSVASMRALLDPEKEDLIDKSGPESCPLDAKPLQPSSQYSQTDGALPDEERIGSLPGLQAAPAHRPSRPQSLRKPSPNDTGTYSLASPSDPSSSIVIAAHQVIAPISSHHPAENSLGPPSSWGHGFQEQNASTSPVDGNVSGFHQHLNSAPLHWRGYMLEKAELTFTSQQLQEIVSQEIKKSADSSSIQLLHPRALDEISYEMRRLRTLSGNLQSSYKAIAERRRVLLSALSAQTDGPDPCDLATVNGLANELTQISVTLDSLTEDIRLAEAHHALLRSMCDTHSSSALAVALRKLNRSFLKQLGEVQTLRQKLETFEIRRDEDRQQTKESRVDLDDFDDGTNPDARRRPPVNAGGRSSNRSATVRKSNGRLSKKGLRRRAYTEGGQLPEAAAVLSTSAHSFASSTKAKSPELDMPSMPPGPPRSPTELGSRPHREEFAFPVQRSDMRAMIKAIQDLHDIVNPPTRSPLGSGSASPSPATVSQRRLSDAEQDSELVAEA